MNENKKKIKDIIVKLLISALIIGVVIGIGYLILKGLGYDNITREELQALIEKTGGFGPLVFIIISFLQVTFVPIPGMVTILAGNYVFGAWPSFFYSLIGMMLGAFLAFFLGRVIGRRFVDWVMGDKETTEKYLKKIKGKEIVVFFFMFLLPMFPDDALCAVAGITSISWPIFIIMQLITRPIGIIGTLFFMSGEIIPYEGWGLVVLGAVAILSIVAFIICFKNSEKINSALEKFIDKICRRKKKEAIPEDAENQD